MIFELLITKIKVNIARRWLKLGQAAYEFGRIFFSLLSFHIACPNKAMVNNIMGSYHCLVLYHNMETTSQTAIDLLF